MVCFSKENTLALVHSPPQNQVSDTPVDRQGDIEFLIKILLPSKISLPLNKLKKIFLPHINFIAALPCPAEPSPRELNHCVC